MSLPKIEHPTFEVELPSTKALIRMRPMLYKEEKPLFMAKQSDDVAAILRAIKQAVTNCVIDTKFDVDKIAIFDLEFLYIRLIAMSKTNIIEPIYKDGEDEREYKFQINLNDIKVEFPEKMDNLIKINDDYHLTMKYPSASLWTNENFIGSANVTEYLILQCIDKVFQGDKIFVPDSEEELKKFLEDLPVSTYTSMVEYLDNLPKLHYVYNYKNSKGSDRKIEFNSLTDFFIYL